MASIIVSPLTEALYGNELVDNDSEVKIYKSADPINVDIDNKQLFHVLLQLIERNVDNRGFKSDNDLYETIKANVSICKMFTSRYVGKCCITNKKYGEDDEGLKERVFDGAKNVLGDRWFFSGFPYHMSVAFLLPIAELMFNLSECIVPIVDFPNINKENELLFINVKRSNGRIQRGVVKCNPSTMVIYRFYNKEDRTYTHPGFMNGLGNELIPYIRTYFNSDYTDAVDNCDALDCVKGIQLEEIIANNPQLESVFRIGDENIPSFKTAFLHSLKKY